MTFGPRRPKRVAVGVDASAESRAALEWAWTIARGFDAELVVVHGVGLLEEGGFRTAVDVGTIVDELRRRMPDETAHRIDIVVEDGPAADVIVRVAERTDADLIVVGSRGLGRTPRVLGSVSEAVLAHARQPVLIVPAS
jgi:nucleotide-binding universal stress UspA family protein